MGTRLFPGLMCPSPHVNHTFDTKCMISSHRSPIYSLLVHCSYFTMTTMSQRPIRRFSVREALDLLFQTDEEGIEVEPEIEEEVSEIVDNDPDFDPDHHETEQSTDCEEEAPEEEAPEEEAPGEEAPGEGAPGERHLGKRPLGKTHLRWNSSPRMATCSGIHPPGQRRQSKRGKYH